MIVYGVDPGSITGVAKYVDGKLVDVKKYSDLDFLLSVDQIFPDQCGVVIEDSRMQTSNFRDHDKDNKRVAFSKGRRVGQVDRLCKLYWQLLERSKSRVLLNVSPLTKGSKKDLNQFQLITGWTGKVSEHEIDAAMVAFPYRHGFQNNGGACRRQR